MKHFSQFLSSKTFASECEELSWDRFSKCCLINMSSYEFSMAYAASNSYATVELKRLKLSRHLITLSISVTKFVLWQIALMWWKVLNQSKQYILAAGCQYYNTEYILTPWWITFNVYRRQIMLLHRNSS